ncbi:hypothetical protein M3Y94_00609500 [Aphelenchoides besseyi]|nr:hypothetical protein M3Y94_00609500 [Aphelenchoides besseyi]
MFSCIIFLSELAAVVSFLVFCQKPKESRAPPIQKNKNQPVRPRDPTTFNETEFNEDPDLKSRSNYGLGTRTAASEQRPVVTLASTQCQSVPLLSILPPPASASAEPAGTKTGETFNDPPEEKVQTRETMRRQSGSNDKLKSEKKSKKHKNKK